MQTRYIVFHSQKSILLIHHHHQVIALDPTSPWGHEIKHTALHKAGEYDSAIDTLEEMLSKIAQSPDPEVRRGLHPCYHHKVIHMIRQSTATGTSAHRAHEQQFAGLFSGLYVTRHACSSTPPPAVSTIELSGHRHSNPCQFSKNLYHPW